MLYGNYRFSCRFETDAVLPPYKGSALRGAFGHALKRVTCALSRRQCPDCLLRERCLYTRIFETRLVQNSEKNKHVSDDPNPFVIEPPPETKTLYRNGERFDFSLLLFGESNRNLPYFVYAFEQMGETGLGRREGKQRGRYVIETVLCGDETLYSRNDRVLRTTGTFQDISVSDAVPPAADAEPQRIAIKIETPLRFKADGRLRDSLPFDVLVRLMLRRISSLMNAYDGGEPPLDYPGLVKRAKTVRMVASKLKWFDWRRYSNRQGTAMQLGGLTGTVVYEGELNEFLPLLKFCEKVHIGKQTSFGLGKIGIGAGRQEWRNLEKE